MIWCVEDDASIRDIEVYALQSTGLEARGFAAFFNGGGAVFSGPEGLKVSVDSGAVGQGVVNAGLYYGF